MAESSHTPRPPHPPSVRIHYFVAPERPGLQINVSPVCVRSSKYCLIKTGIQADFKGPLLSVTADRRSDTGRLKKLPFWTAAMSCTHVLFSDPTNDTEPCSGHVHQSEESCCDTLALGVFHQTGASFTHCEVVVRHTLIYYLQCTFHSFRETSVYFIWMTSTVIMNLWTICITHHHIVVISDLNRFKRIFRLFLGVFLFDRFIQLKFFTIFWHIFAIFQTFYCDIFVFVFPKTLYILWRNKCTMLKGK